MYNVIHEFPNRMKGAYMQLEREPAQLALAAMPVLWSVLFLLINHEETGENNKKAKRNILSFLAVFLCFLVFQVGLLLLYLCSFTSAEAQNFVSLERYNSEYILGITCFLLLYLIYVYHEHAQQHCTWKQIGCIGCLLLLLYNSVSFRQIYRDVVRKNAAVQASYDFNGYPTYMNLDTKFEKYLTPENKVYLVTENWLFSYYVLNYQLLPAKCNRTPDESFALNNLSEKIQMLKDENYTHICLCNLAPDFAERNAAFFEDAITTISLYEIIWDGEGAMKLINARPLKSL